MQWMIVMQSNRESSTKNILPPPSTTRHDVAGEPPMPPRLLFLVILLEHGAITGGFEGIPELNDIGIIRASQEIDVFDRGTIARFVRGSSL